MTKICPSFVGDFSRVGGNLDRPEQLVICVLHFAEVRGHGEVYGRFMGGSDRNRSNSGHLGRFVQYMQNAKSLINTGDCTSR